MQDSSTLKLAIVILNYNGRSHLETYLPSVKDHAPSYADIIVVDNASTDDSVDFLRSRHPEIRLQILPKNLGFAGGYAEALATVEAEYYFILNSDVELTATSIEPVIHFMDNHREVAACQPKVLAHQRKDEFEHAGASGGWIDRWGYPFCRGRIQSHCEIDQGQYDDIQKVFWCTGAALFVRADVYHKSGGFDPAFFAHMEEIDLCWRFQHMGYDLYAIPDAIVYHLGGGTLSYMSPFKTYLNFRNSLYMILKNEQRGFLFARIGVRLLLDFIAGAYFIVKGEFKGCWAIIRAHFAFYARIPYLLKQRKAFKTTHGTSKKKGLDGVWKGSIIYSFFILKQKQFNKLDGII